MCIPLHVLGSFAELSTTADRRRQDFCSLKVLARGRVDSSPTVLAEAVLFVKIGDEYQYVKHVEIKHKRHKGPDSYW